jgi:alkaline phosphatase D
MFPEPEMQALDGGRAFNGGNPPAEIRFNDAHVPNPQRARRRKRLLGAEQKAVVQGQAQELNRVWKIWANSLGTLDWRADPQNLPAGLTKESLASQPTLRKPWAAVIYGTAWTERA